MVLAMAGLSYIYNSIVRKGLKMVSENNMRSFLTLKAITPELGDLSLIVSLFNVGVYLTSKQ